MAPDKLEWLDERRYRVGARDDGAVQVGGINVFPNRVRSVLQEHPDIAAAAVRLMSPAEGRRLKAFIVPALAGTDIDALRNGLDAWVAKRLSGPERPRAYTFGRSLPADQMGKAAEWPVTADAP
jgi:acyl-coenzyme A synthetase/AMP-(fatty) acid ligase